MTLTLLWLAACTDGVQPDGKDTDSGTVVTDTDTGPADADGDGYDETVDCDDQDAAVHPDAQELCDAGDVDEDCDGLADDADDSATGQTAWYTDADADTYGDPATEELHCDSATLVAVADDCDDQNAAINPGAAEVCDDADVDEDCDGDADDDDDSVTGTITVYLDLDADGYGDLARPQEVCTIGLGQVENADDCDDGNYLANPGATEVCDEFDLDEDCDGLGEDADDSVTGQTAAWTDADGDGYGDPATEVLTCETTGLVLMGEDCDDTDPARNPDTVWYPDADGDAYGDGTAPFTACETPDGALPDGTDCNDADAAVNPGAVEICDADDIDEDCNGSSEDADAGVDTSTWLTWYRDADKDSYGDDSDLAYACDRPSGYIEIGGDCDDAHLLANPDMGEICDDGLDNDCNGEPDQCQQTGDVRLNATNAAALYTSTQASGELGTWLGGLGDLTGDGQDDLLVGARDWSELEAYGGAAFLFSGPSVSGNTTTATTAFYGTDADDNLGNEGGAGDFDGDGVMDVLLPAWGATGAAGSSAGWVGLWFGPFDAVEDRTTADMSWEGSDADEYLGAAVATGDFNGDGAVDAAWTGYVTAGLYVLSGPVTRGTPPSPALWATAPGVGSYPNELAAGDVDGDGIDELATSAFNRTTTDPGIAWIVDGDQAGADLDTVATARFTGDDRNDYFGWAIDLGDGNGDGYDDLLVSAVGVDDGALAGGAVYLYNGPLAGEFATSDASASFLGTVANNYGGGSVAFIGDFDRDGTGDFAIGLNQDDTVKKDSGAAAVFYGPTADGYTFDDADFRVLGTATSDQAGDMVAAGGDLTGDGTADLAVAAPLADDGATDGGVVFVVGGSGL